MAGCVHSGPTAGGIWLSYLALGRKGCLLACGIWRKRFDIHTKQKTCRHIRDFPTSNPLIASLCWVEQLNFTPPSQPIESCGGWWYHKHQHKHHHYTPPPCRCDRQHCRFHTFLKLQMRVTQTRASTTEPAKLILPVGTTAPAVVTITAACTAKSRLLVSYKSSTAKWVC